MPPIVSSSVSPVSTPISPNETTLPVRQPALAATITVTGKQSSQSKRNETVRFLHSSPPKTVEEAEEVPLGVEGDWARDWHEEASAALVLHHRLKEQLNIEIAKKGGPLIVDSALTERPNSNLVKGLREKLNASTADIARLNHERERYLNKISQNSVEIEHYKTMLQQLDADIQDKDREIETRIIGARNGRLKAHEAKMGDKTTIAHLQHILRTENAKAKHEHGQLNAQYKATQEELNNIARDHAWTKKQLEEAKPSIKKAEDAAQADRNKAIALQEQKLSAVKAAATAQKELASAEERIAELQAKLAASEKKAEGAAKATTKAIRKNGEKQTTINQLEAQLQKITGRLESVELLNHDTVAKSDPELAAQLKSIRAQRDKAEANNRKLQTTISNLTREKLSIKDDYEVIIGELTADKAAIGKEIADMRQALYDYIDNPDNGMPEDCSEYLVQMLEDRNLAFIVPSQKGDPVYGIPNDTESDDD